VHVASVRQIEMAAATKRDKIKWIESQFRAVCPSFNVVGRQPTAALIAERAGVIIPPLDSSGQLSELIPEKKAMRAHWHIVAKSGTAPLLFRAGVGKCRCSFALQAPARFGVATDEGISSGSNRATAITLAHHHRIADFTQHEQPAELLADYGPSIGDPSCLSHAAKMAAVDSEAAARPLVSGTKFSFFGDRLFAAIAIANPLTLSSATEFVDCSQQTETVTFGNSHHRHLADEVYRPALLVQQAVQRFHSVAVDSNHFCFFRNSSMARRTSSATDSPVFTARALSCSTDGSDR